MPLGPTSVRQIWRLSAITLAIMAAYYLLTRHAAHTLGVLPYLLILACPLMHLFGHGHRHRDNHSHPDINKDERSP